MKSLKKLLRLAMTATAMGAVAASIPFTALAQDAEPTPAEKVGLMASALRLKDQGEYAAAMEKVSLLRELSPSDPSVNRLYDELVEAMDAEGIPFAVIDTEEPTSMETNEDVDQEANEAESDETVSPDDLISEAQALAADGDYPDAIAVLSRAKSITTDAAQRNQIENLTADYILNQESSFVTTAIQNSKADLARARELAADGRYSPAYTLIDAAISRLPANTGTEDLINELENAKKKMLLDQAQELAVEGSGTAAMAAFQRYERDPSNQPAIQNQADEVRKTVENPYAYDIREISPKFVETFQEVEDLLMKGRAQFVNGDVEGARQTFAQVETIDPSNVEAKAFLYEIAERLTESGYLDRQKTRSEMLNQVSRSWQQPRIYQEDREGDDDEETGSPVLVKLEEIVIPRVTFTGASLARAVQSLSEMSEEFDRGATSPEDRGVNMVVTGQGGTDRQVNFSVRNLSLLRILDIVAQQTGYQWDVVDEIVEFQPSDRVDGNNRLQRAIIPISKGTLDLILDIQSASGGRLDGGGSSVSDDPFAAPSVSSGPSSGDSQSSLENFFEASGIGFSDIPGASIVNRGSRLLVNQTSRNIEEIRQTLRELDITDQVEIEAKFMEVVQGNLDELGFEWNVANQGNALVAKTQTTTTTSSNGNNGTSSNSSSRTFDQTTVGPPPTTGFVETLSNSSNSSSGSNSSFSTTTGTSVSPQFDSFGNPATVPTKGYGSNLSTLSSVFGTSAVTETGNVTVGGQSTNFSVAPGSPPNALDLGADIVSSFFTSGVLGNFDVNLLIRAVSRLEDTDLLSAPRVTVMSGKSANIVVAQEFIYPTSYGEPTVSVDSGGSTSTIGGSSGGAVALASGVPEDFETRNIGVELTVTPTVEPNDKINLSLQPRVTEFEGYVAYGGPNIAITGNSAIQSPSGYFQPIFSTRTVETEVTVFDGATVVLGGLTREEIKAYQEKIPILGDIPLIGRLFRSEGETSQKQNLIIFVTANLISPGGSPAKQTFEGTESNSLFQNPTVISPGGILSRGKKEVEED